MTIVQRCAGLVLLAGLFLAPACNEDGSQLSDDEVSGIALVDGYWFIRSTFVPTTLYSVEGKLTTVRPSRIEETIELNGGFVVPPYGEAHNHNIEPIVFRGMNLDDKIDAYIGAGVWYVKVPGSDPTTLSDVRERIADVDVLEAMFSGGAGITTAGGHPEPQIQRVISAGAMPAEAGEGVSYFTIDSLAELTTKWPRVLASSPDFVKAYLLHSGEGTPPEPGWKGVDPVLLDGVVARAHAEGLSVSAHVETAADFRAAVTAGVDEINHLPGIRPDWSRPLRQYELDERDAAVAAAGNVTVVTTAQRGSRTFRNLPETRTEADAREEYRNLQIRNLTLLKEHGVRLVIGTDQYTEFSTIEARWLAGLGVFTNAEVLVMLCETTPRSIFPERAIGRLEDGYDASFLVLAGDPLVDIDFIDDIVMRFHRGRLIVTSAANME